jgi:hypothetical protein
MYIFLCKNDNSGTVGLYGALYSRL